MRILQESLTEFYFFLGIKPLDTMDSQQTQITLFINQYPQVLSTFMVVFQELLPTPAFTVSANDK